MPGMGGTLGRSDTSHNLRRIHAYHVFFVMVAALSPRKLDHFLQIVQAGSVSRAADRLDMSQPALSRELRELEQELGVPLLKRHARGVTLTPAGEALKRRAELILGLLGTVRDEVNAAADQPSGRVAFGMPPSMSGAFTAPLVQAFRERYPAVRLQVREGTSTQLRTALLAREIDFAVLSAPVSEPQLDVRPFFTEPLVLVGPPGAVLALKPQLTIDDVASYPLILPMLPNATRMLIETAFEKHGRHPQVALETDVAPIAQFIARGLGYAILPACALSAQALVSATMVHAPVEDLAITWLLSAPAGVSMSLGTRKLREMLCEHTRLLTAGGRLLGRYVGP
jgi:LysR family nitrogen assimilation transcriptional regulator